MAIRIQQVLIFATDFQFETLLRVEPMLEETKFVLLQNEQELMEVYNVIMKPTIVLVDGHGECVKMLEGRDAITKYMAKDSNFKKLPRLMTWH